MTNTENENSDVVGLDSLVEKFNVEVEIVIKLEFPITLDILEKKRDQINSAMKQLKRAEKMLDDIHSEYTYMLECTINA